MAWDDWGNDDSEFQYDFGQSPPLPSYPDNYDYGSRPQKKLDFGLDTQPIEDRFGKIWHVPNEIANNDDMLKEFILRQRSEDSKTNDYRYRPEPLLVPGRRTVMNPQPGENPESIRAVEDYSPFNMENIKTFGSRAGEAVMGMADMAIKGPYRMAQDSAMNYANQIAVNEAVQSEKARRASKPEPGFDYGNAAWEGAKAVSPLPLAPAWTLAKQGGYLTGLSDTKQTPEEVYGAAGEIAPLAALYGYHKLSGRFGGGDEPPPPTPPVNEGPPPGLQQMEQYPGGEPFGEVSNIPPRQTGHMGGEDISLSPEGRYAPAGVPNIGAGFRTYIDRADAALGKPGVEPLPEAQPGFNVNRTVFDALTPDSLKQPYLPSTNQRWMDAALPSSIPRDANFGLREPPFKAGVGEAPLEQPVLPERPVEAPGQSVYDPQYTDFADAGSWGGRDTGLAGRNYGVRPPVQPIERPVPEAPPIPEGLGPVEPVPTPVESAAPPVPEQAPDLSMESPPEGMTPEQTQAYIDQKIAEAGGDPSKLDFNALAKLLPNFKDDKLQGSASSKLPPDEEPLQPGMGMDRTKSFEEQWKQAVAEAKILGMDPGEYDTLEELQNDITYWAKERTARSGGRNPLAEAIRTGRLEPDRPSTLEHVIKPEPGPAEPTTGTGLDSDIGISFEEQWARAVKEAKILGIDYKREANLNELQQAVSAERFNQIEKTGKDPIIQAAVSGKGGLKDIEELASWDLESHFPDTKIQGSASEEGPLKSVEEFPSTADEVIKGKFGKPLEDIPAFEKKGVAEMPKKGGIGSKLTPAEKAEIQRALEENKKPLKTAKAPSVEIPVKMGYRMPHDSRSFGLSEAGKFILDMKPTGKLGFDKLITRMQGIALAPELTVDMLDKLRDLGQEATRHPDAPPNFRQEYYSKSADASGAPPTLGPLEPPISPEKIGVLSKGEKAYNVGDELPKEPPLKLSKGPLKEIPMEEKPLLEGDLKTRKNGPDNYDIIGPDGKKLGEVNKAWFRNGGEGWTYDSMRGHPTIKEALKYFARDQRQRLKRGLPIETKPPEGGGKISGSMPLEDIKPAPHETEKLSSVDEFPSESNDTTPPPKNLQGSTPPESEAFDPNWRPEDLNKPEKLAADGQKVIDEIKKSGGKSADERLQEALDEAQNRVNEIKAGKATFQKRWTQRGASLAEAYRRYVGKSEEQTLADMGSGGKKLVDMMQRIISDAHNFAGKQSLALDAKMKGISKEQFAQAVDVVEGKGKSTDPAVNALADEINNQLAVKGPELYGKTLKVKNPVTGRLEPFKAREKYFPHTYEEGFSISEKSMPELLRSIQEEFKVSAEKAQQILDDAKENNYRTLDAMKSRLRNLPGYRKEYDVLMNHFIDMAKRAKEEEIFGENTLQGKQENAVNTELNKILAEKGKAARVRAEGIVNTFLERAPSRAEGWQTEAANAVTSVQAFTKLSRSIIKNIPGGLVAGISRAETVPWMKSIADTFTKSGRDFAKESGTLVSLWRDSAKDIGYGSKGSKVFGIEQGERWLRTFSANLGKHEANTLFERIKDRGGKAKPREVAQLNDLLVEDDIGSVLKQDKLTEAQLARAANRMTDLTQGRADSLALPERWTNNPAANVITQFKKFGFIQARNMKNAIKQNPASLPRILIAQQILGGLANVISSTVTGRERKKGIAGLIENASYAFGFGMISDALDASLKGGERALTFAAGPSAGDLAEAFDVVKEVKQSKQPGLRRLEPFAEALTKRIPYAGAAMSKWMKTRYKESMVEQ